MANFLLFHEKGIKEYLDENTGFYTLDAVKVLPDSDRRGAELRLNGDTHHLASVMKRLENQ